MKRMGSVVDREPLDVDDAKADSMGGLELIELGSARRQEIFRGGRAKLGVALPNFMGVFSGLLGEGIPLITGLLSDALSIPLDLISTGIDEVLGGLAGLVGQIPIIGTLGATVLLAANVLVQAAADVPIEALKFAGNLGAAFKTLSTAQQAQFTQLAMAAILQATPDAQKSAVQQKLTTAPPPGSLVVEDAAGESGPWGEVAVTLLNVAAVGAFAIL